MEKYSSYIKQGSNSGKQFFDDSVNENDTRCGGKKGSLDIYAKYNKLSQLLELCV